MRALPFSFRVCNCRCALKTPGCLYIHKSVSMNRCDLYEAPVRKHKVVDVCSVANANSEVSYVNSHNRRFAIDAQLALLICVAAASPASTLLICQTVEPWLQPRSTDILENLKFIHDMKNRGRLLRSLVNKSAQRKHARVYDINYVPTSVQCHN